MKKASRIGRDASRWAEAMIHARGIEGVRVLQGFVHLAKTYPSSVINQASQVAVKGNLFRLRPLKELCKRLEGKQETLTFTHTHPIIRPLSEYQNLIQDASRIKPKERG
ncbi:MAG: hypothetical protein GTN69_08835 [Armatimonadetes bacterium]|nr:hypothetical protein [Armatimonadota bacterium]